MNIESATAEDVISKLMDLAIQSYEQFQLYPDGSIEQKQIIKAQKIPAEILLLLQDTEESDKSQDEKDAILSYAKEELLEEQNKRLHEAGLAQQFLKGEIECTVRA